MKGLMSLELLVSQLVVSLLSYYQTDAILRDLIFKPSVAMVRI